MISLVAPILVAVVATVVATAEARAQLLSSARGPLGTYGMRPCKKCGGANLHSRDELLATDDGKLNEMQNDLTKQVGDLEDEVEELQKKHAAEIGKLNKRLGDMDAAYKKFGKDTVARTTKFAAAKADASKVFTGSLESTESTHAEIAKLHASMQKMREAVAPSVDKMISGKGWPKGCKCAKAKSLLQRLQAALNFASLEIDDTAEDASVPGRKGEALLRRSAKMSKPADQKKYKLVRAVQQLEEKRAKLMQDKTKAITGFGEQQRITLDRIDTAKIKSNLKASTERKYKDSDENLAKALKDQNDAASSYLSSAKAKLARLQKAEAAGQKLFKEFRAELQKCKCL